MLPRRHGNVFQHAKTFCSANLSSASVKSWGGVEDKAGFASQEKCSPLALRATILRSFPMRDPRFVTGNIGLGHFQSGLALRVVLLNGKSRGDEIARVGEEQRNF